ncbi:Small GTP-binding protein domain [Trinorchestia longiramus]|nr:Small GTP-binding protein domain [Trinorchestia longiramus]
MSLTYGTDKHSSINENENIENLENDSASSKVHSVVSGLSEDEELDTDDVSTQDSFSSFVERKPAGLRELSALYSSCILEDNLSSLEGCITNYDETFIPSHLSNVGQSKCTNDSSLSTTSSYESLHSTVCEDLPFKGGSETSLFSGANKYYSAESFTSKESEKEISLTLYDREDNYTESCPDISVKDKIRLDFRVSQPNLSMNAKSTPEKLDRSQPSKRKKSLISSFRKGRKGNRKCKSEVSSAAESSEFVSNEESLDLKSDDDSASVLSSVPSTSSERKLEDAAGITSQDPEDEPVSIVAGTSVFPSEQSGTKSKVSKLKSIRNQVSGTKEKCLLRKSPRLGFLRKKDKTQVPGAPLQKQASGSWSCSEQSSQELELDLGKDESNSSCHVTDRSQHTVDVDIPSMLAGPTSTSDVHFSANTPPSSPLNTPHVSPIPNPSLISSRLREFNNSSQTSVSASPTESDYTDSKKDQTFSSASLSDGENFGEFKQLEKETKGIATKLKPATQDILIPTLQVFSSTPSSSITNQENSIRIENKANELRKLREETTSLCSSILPKRILTDEEVNVIASQYNSEKLANPIVKSTEQNSPRKPPRKLPLESFAPFVSSNLNELPSYFTLDSHRSSSPEFLKSCSSAELSRKSPSPERSLRSISPTEINPLMNPPKTSAATDVQMAKFQFTTSKPGKLPILQPEFGKKETNLLQQYESISSSHTSSMSAIDNQLSEISAESLNYNVEEPQHCMPQHSYIRKQNDESQRGRDFVPKTKEISTTQSFGISFEDIDISLNSTDSKTSSSAGSSGDRNEYLFKILVIGELGTGKTSIIKRYVHQFFSQHYRATIGVDFALKVLSWDSNTVIRLQLWDIAGQERFGNMTRVYYKEAVGAFIVFDVTRAQTFDCITKWKNDLDTKVTLPNGSPIPTVLLANKCDQPKEGIVNSPARMDEYCRESGYAGWFETSAKENINIDEAAKFLVNQILCIEQNGLLTTDTYDQDKFSIDSSGQNRSSPQEPNCKC